MQYHYFTVSAQNPTDDAARLNQFIASQRVINVQQTLVADGQQSFYSVCVTVQATKDRLDNTLKKSAVDYREKLSPADFERYSKIRTLRNELAKQEGIQAYTIFTNEQLASIACLPTLNITNISKIEGIGDKRLTQYAPLFVAELNKKASE